MNNTKKLTAILMASTVFMASLTAFAKSDIQASAAGGGGSAEYKTATVTIDAQKDGAFLIVPQTITVSENKADEYGFTDSDEGVSMLDALVTMHEIKFGDAFTPATVNSYLTTGYNEEYDYYYISTSFGESAPNGGYSASGYFINNNMVSLTAEKAIITDGDKVEYAFYTDTEMYMDCYTAFMPERMSTVAGTPVELPLFMIEMPMWYPENELEPISDEYDFEAMTINLVNEDGSISEALTDENGDLTVPDENGIVTLTFDTPGTYIVTASGFIGEDYPIIAPYCFVTVKPEPTSVKITMDVQKDGAFMFIPQEIEVSSYTAEKYGFNDSFDGVTFLDALVAVHEMKYGEAFTAATVGDYLTSGVNPEYGTYYINTAFGEAASATAFYTNGFMGYDTAEAAILSDGDTVEYCFYQDTTGWSDCYTAFGEKAVTVLVGEDIELTILKNTYDENWVASLLPIDGTDENNVLTINTVKADGSISEALRHNGEEITPDANGKITLSFDEPGKYIVTAQGIVNGYAAIFAPYCIVTVNEQYSLDNISIKASATVKKADGAEDAKVIIAVYDKNGVLVGSEIKAAENGEISFDISIPNDSRVKMFIWDNENGMKPLTSIG